MITYTMTKDELMNEVKNDCQWLDSLRNGIAVKYAKQLNPKKATGEAKLLGVTTYITPRNNKVIVAWVRIKAGKYVTVESTHYFEYTTKNGGIQYIIPIYSNLCYNVPKTFNIVTGHAIQRLKERAGMSFMDFVTYKANNLKTCVSFHNTYVYKGKEVEMLNFGDKGLFTIEQSDWGLVYTTFVNYELLGEDQMATVKECIENISIYNTRKINDMIDTMSSAPRKISRKVFI